MELDQRLSESQSPLTLAGRVRNLVLPELHLKVWQATAQRMEWNTVVDFRIQIVGLIIANHHIPRLP